MSRRRSLIQDFSFEIFPISHLSYTYIYKLFYFIQKSNSNLKIHFLRTYPELEFWIFRLLGGCSTYSRGFQASELGVVLHDQASSLEIGVWDFQIWAQRGNRDLRDCKIMGFESGVWGRVRRGEDITSRLSGYRLIGSILLSAGYIVEGLHSFKFP